MSTRRNIIETECPRCDGNSDYIRICEPGSTPSDAFSFFCVCLRCGTTFDTVFEPEPTHEARYKSALVQILDTGGAHWAGNDCCARCRMVTIAARALHPEKLRGGRS